MQDRKNTNECSVKSVVHINTEYRNLEIKYEGQIPSITSLVS